MTGEERERKMLEDQIARAKTESDIVSQDAGSSELQKKEGEKISLSLFGSTATPQPQTSVDTASLDQGASQDQDNGSGPSKPGPLAIPSLSFGAMPSMSAPTPIVNPLKRPTPLNVFKSAKPPKSDTDSGLGSMKQKQLSEVERLMKEDQARKARGGYQGQGPRRG